MVRRRLIINADDYGLTPGVTRGIVDAMRGGVVTAASVLVNMPGWEDAAQRLRHAPAGAAFGLHVNLVAGRPLTSARSLVDRATGQFHSLHRCCMLSAAGRLDHDDLVAECAAQLERLRGTGVTVSHVDSHRHVHVLSPIARAVRDVAGLLPVRRPIGECERPFTDLRAGVKQLLLRAALRGRSREPRSVLSPDHFAGLSLQGTRRFSERLLRIVDALPAGTTELMVHPGYADAALFAIDPYTVDRERELDALMAGGVREGLAQRNIELATYQ